MVRPTYSNLIWYIFCGQDKAISGYVFCWYFIRRCGRLKNSGTMLDCWPIVYKPCPGPTIPHTCQSGRPTIWETATATRNSVPPNHRLTLEIILVTHAWSEQTYQWNSSQKKSAVNFWWQITIEMLARCGYISIVYRHLMKGWFLSTNCVTVFAFEVMGP